MASPIEQLPSEILHEISEYLGQESWFVDRIFKQKSKDLLSFRRTSKTFAAAGLKVLMRAISFVTTEKSLFRLKAMSEDPKLAPLVRTLVWEMHRLPRHDTMDEWAREARFEDADMASIADEFDNCEDSEIASDANVFDPVLAMHGQPPKADEIIFPPKVMTQAGWEQYQKIYAFQQFFPKFAEYFFHLVLPGFTNLNSLRFHTELDGEWMGPSCQNHYTETMLVPNMYNPGLVYGAEQLYSLLSAAAVTRTPLTEINSGYLSYTFFDQPMTYLCQNQILAATLGNLIALRLLIVLDEGTIAEPDELWPVFDSVPGITAIKKHGLSTFLHELPKLECLTLFLQHQDFSFYVSRGSDHIVPIPGLHLNHILGTQKWKNLTALELTWFKIEAEGLIKRLDEHAGRLQMLTLSKVHLLDGHWATMFNHIQSLNIEEVQLRGSFTCSKSVEVFDVNAIVRADESLELIIRGVAFESVRFWNSHALSRLLTGNPCEQDDGITKCVDFWLRGKGRKQLNEYLTVEEDGMGAFEDVSGYFQFDCRKNISSQRHGSSLSFGSFLKHNLWKPNEGFPEHEEDYGY